MDDLRQSRQGRVVQSVLAEYRFKRTPSIDMAELGAIDVEGHGARLHCDPSHILRLDIEKLGVGIDETPDQPRAGDPVYRRVPARDKAHGSVAPRAFPATVFLQVLRATSQVHSSTTCPPGSVTYAARPRPWP